MKEKLEQLGLAKMLEHVRGCATCKDMSPSAGEAMSRMFRHGGFWCPELRTASAELKVKETFKWAMSSLATLTDQDLATTLTYVFLLDGYQAILRKAPAWEVAMMKRQAQAVSTLN